MWFKADLPILLTRLLRGAGFHRRDPAFWPDDSEYKFWIRTQWERWLASHCRTTAAGRTFSKLLNCHYCVSFHLSWIAGVCVAIFISPVEALCCVAYPTVALILFRLT